MYMGERINTTLTGRLDRMKIGTKLLAVFLLAFLIPMIAITALMSAYLFNRFLEKDLAEASVNVRRIENRVLDILNRATDLSDRFYTNDRIHQTVLKTYGGTWEVFQEYEQTAFIDDFLRSYPEVASVRLYVENQTMLDNSHYVRTTDAIREEAWFRRAIERDGKIEWKWQKDGISGNWYLSLTRLIRRPKTYQYIGVLTVNIDNDFMQRTFADEPLETHIAVDSTIHFTNAPEYRQTVPPWLPEELSRIPQTYTGKNVMAEGGKKAVIAKSFSPRGSLFNMFQVACVIPMAEIMKPTLRMTLVSSVILLVGVLFSIACILLFSRYFSKRILLLRSEIVRVVQKDFEILPSIGGTDELSEIHDALFKTIQEIKKLIDEVYVRKVAEEKLVSRQKEIRFKMLSSQINPHFLYNTLETIRMKALSNDDIEVAHTVKLLAKILRRNLEMTENPVTLASELESVSNYLDIQRIRFGERIGYEVINLCGLDQFTILPLLIQPIVENSFIHGLESSMTGGFIQITVFLENEGLMVSVTDNGKGIEPERLSSLQTELERNDGDTGQAIGLLNVHQRIRLYYGSGYGLSISSAPREGTTVTIRLPKPNEGERHA